MAVATYSAPSGYLASAFDHLLAVTAYHQAALHHLGNAHQCQELGTRHRLLGPWQRSPKSRSDEGLSLANVPADPFGDRSLGPLLHRSPNQLPWSRRGHAVAASSPWLLHRMPKDLLPAPLSYICMFDANAPADPVVDRCLGPLVRRGPKQLPWLRRGHAVSTSSPYAQGLPALRAGPPMATATQSAPSGYRANAC